MKTVLKIFDMGRKILHDLKHLRGGLDIINNDMIFSRAEEGHLGR